MSACVCVCMCHAKCCRECSSIMHHSCAAPLCAVRGARRGEVVEWSPRGARCGVHGRVVVRALEGGVVAGSMTRTRVDIAGLRPQLAGRRRPHLGDYSRLPVPRLHGLSELGSI